MTGPRLLLVEDDPELAAMLVELLEDEGYVVDVARDGQRGLHLGLTRDYDIILLDRGLPAIEGLDLLTRLRGRGARRRRRSCCRRWAIRRDRVDGLDAGAEDYLGKPFDVDELLARLRALRRRHLDQVPRAPGASAGTLDVGDPLGPADRQRRGGPVRAGGGAADVAGPAPTTRLQPGGAASAPSSRARRTRASSTPTCTICAASWAGRSWTPSGALGYRAGRT